MRVLRSIRGCGDHAFPIAEAEIKKDSDKIRRVFQDPLGHHLIVSMDSKECHYLGKGDKRVILSSSKLKGHIESVAWNLLDETERTTAPILLGTSNGEGMDEMRGEWHQKEVWPERRRGGGSRDAWR